MEAIDEFNNYGAANFSERLRIDEGTASQLYGFKATVFVPTMPKIVFESDNTLWLQDHENKKRKHSMSHPP